MAFHIAMLKIMLEEKSTSCETLSVKVFKEGWRNGRGGGFGHWRCWLPGFALNQPGHPRTNLLLVTMGCRFVFLISAGLFQEALRLQRDAGTLGRCLIQLGHGSAALLKMGCPAVPRCLQFVRLGVSVWLFFLQKPKRFAEPTTALLQFQSPEQHFPFPSNKEKQCSCSAQEMPIADQNQAQFFFLAQHPAAPVPAAGSTADLSSPQDPNPLPARFPVGLPHVSEELELLRVWTMVWEKLRGETQPSSLEDGQAAGCQQHLWTDTPVSSPCLRTLTKNCPQINPLWHPGSPSCILQERANFPLRWELNLEPVLPVTLLQSWWECSVGLELSNCQTLDCQIPTEPLYLTVFS